MQNRLLKFLVILTFLIAYTFFKAIQLWPEEEFLAITCVVGLFFIMLGPTFLYRRNHQVFGQTWFKILSWCGSLTMAFWSIFVFISIPVDLVHFIVYAISPSFAQSVFHDVNLSVFYLALLLSLIGVVEVFRGPRVKKIEVLIKDLPKALDGLTLAQISDVHIGSTVQKAYVEKVVKKTNEISADFIFLTGDMVDAKVESVAEHLQPFENLKARHGVFYVTGNHEYYWDTLAFIQKMKDLGIIPLLNENSVVRIGSSQVMIAGVTDPTGEHMLEGHTPNVFKSISTKELTQLKILLSHRPDSYLEAEAMGVDLQLSGHTHAGQYFPFNILIKFFHRYHRGLYQHGEMWLYVNPGTGYWGPANRFAVASEISLITVKKS